MTLRTVKDLSVTECWQLLGAATVGRLVTCVDQTIEIYPVNFMIDAESILFASAPGSKLEQLSAQPSVVFEVDGESTRGYWSVVVKGNAYRLAADDEIESSGVLTLQSLEPTDKSNYVRIVPERTTGRLFGKPRSRKSHPRNGRSGLS